MFRCNSEYSENRKYLSSSFSIENGLKQGDNLQPSLFNFALEYAIRKLDWDYI